MPEMIEAQRVDWASYEGIPDRLIGERVETQDAGGELPASLDGRGWDLIALEFDWLMESREGDE